MKILVRKIFDHLNFTKILFCLSYLITIPANGQQIEISTESLSLLEIDGNTFKDHNKNGSLDVYEDWRLSPEQRAENLVSLMTIEEKAGAMLHGTLPINGIGYELSGAEGFIVNRHINSMITRLGGFPEQIAEENNRVQALAERSRLGIPLTISTDPRHHFQYTEGASVANTGFSQWPETLGFAALADPALVRQFGDIARQEYRAVGIHMGLSPQADLSTEPRWSRINGTFGEDAELARSLVQAYIEGFQGGSDGAGIDGVSLVVKHWAGYGAAEEGFDSHNYYGRYATFPGDNFAYHLIPFEGAFAANIGGVMPTYSILKNLVVEGTQLEQVGAGYERFMLTDLLREQYGFEGVILSDWGITRDCPEVCINGIDDGSTQTFGTFSTGWGVIDITMEERFAKGIEAGIDQFGGVEDSEVLASVIHQGMISQQRIDDSVQRIMEQKFSLGVFENPLVDIEHAGNLVGNAEFSQKAGEVERSATVLLENKNNLLPIHNNQASIYLYGVDSEIVRSYGFRVVNQPEQADLAIIRASTPFEVLHPNYVFGRMYHEGDLAFTESNPEYEQIIAASSVVPTIVTVYLDRPAILTNIKDEVDALIGNFGISDEALMDVIVGLASPQGQLPFELPANMESVRQQYPDVPFDIEDELYPFGFGLEYVSE
jgi:beta-glucosidase